MGKEAQPYIVVYTDSDDMPNVTEGNLYEGVSRRLQVVFEIGAASAFKRTDDTIVIQFSSSDYGLEWQVDAIESQIKAALYGDPQSEWGALFKRFAPRVYQWRSRRGGQNDRGIRFNARRVVLICSTLVDIVPGVRPVPAHPIWQFAQLALDHPEENVYEAGNLAMNLIANNFNAPIWRKAQARLGLEDEAIKALNVTDTPLPYPGVEQEPYDAQDGDQPPLLEEIGLNDEDRDDSITRIDPLP